MLKVPRKFQKTLSPGPESGDIQLNPRIFEKTIHVAPCGSEHWISTDLFKFRLWATDHKFHVIGFCPKNYIPHFSLFCDELVLVPHKPDWYSGFSVNGFGCSKDFILGIEDHRGIRREFSKVPEKRVIEHFRHRKVYMCKSSHDKFFELDLPENQLICEVKKESSLRKTLADFDGPMLGLNYAFQRDLVSRAGRENYMTVQILASKHLNWQFFCHGGSANLFAVVPVKTLFMQDRTITPSVKKVIRGLSPHQIWPCCFDLQESVDRCVQFDVLKRAFKDMSALNLDFEIVLLENL